MAEAATAEHASRNGAGAQDHLPPVTDGRGVAERALGLAGGLAGRLAKEFSTRIPKADLDDRDPDFIREQLPLSWLFATLWYRAETRNLGNVPENGPVLLVGNHTGGSSSPEVVTFTLAFSAYFGVERRFHQLAHNLVTTFPLLGSYLKRFGTVTAGRENSRKALEAGAAVLVFPGGDYDAHCPTSKRNEIDFGNRKGFIKLALEMDVPIVPVVTVGGQETAFWITRGETIAKVLGFDRIFRAKVFPVGFALPFGLQPLLFGHFPLPAKVTSEVLPAIHLREEFGEDPDVDEIHDYIVQTMQDTLDALASERRFPVIG